MGDCRSPHNQLVYVVGTPFRASISCFSLRLDDAQEIRFVLVIRWAAREPPLRLIST
jgi:hypothetical protein